MWRPRLLILGIVLVGGLLVILLAARVRASKVHTLESAHQRIQLGMTRDQVVALMGEDYDRIGPDTLIWVHNGPAGGHWQFCVKFQRQGQSGSPPAALVIKTDIYRNGSTLARLAGYLGL